MEQLAAILLSLIAFHPPSQHPEERVILFPDRNLYISGETVSFSALIRPGSDSASVSRILYCELVTPGGRMMAGGKYASVNSIVSGGLVIPPDLITGVYYLKAYTKKMRNEGPSVYSFDYIRVINPERSEVYGGSVDESGADGQKYFKMDTSMVNSVKIPAGVLPKDTVTIRIDDSSICRTLRNMTISVIPDHTLSDRFIKSKAETITSDSFPAETKGILITGIVKNRSLGTVITGAGVNLSITGKGRDFMSATTGSDGRFLFQSPDYYGDRDIFLCTENTDSLDVRILVDNDFCNLPVDLPDEGFKLSASERETALRMSVNFRLSAYFDGDSTAESHKTAETPVFYGKPDEILSMNEYVKLPTLEDYFNQLPVPVKVRKRGGHKYFKVLGTQDELLETDPLVMVDLVVIDDPEKILALDPGDISRIDIVNALYKKGEKIYGGIINIISAKGDFAGISLPSSGVFINYSFLNKTRNIPPEFKSGLPDARNTVFWKVIRDNEDCSLLSFIAPSAPGKYLVVIRGVDEEGDEVSATLSFNVTDIQRNLF